MYYLNFRLFGVLHQKTEYQMVIELKILFCVPLNTVSALFTP